METIIRFLVLMLAMAAASGLAPAAEPSPAEKSPPSATAYGSAFEGYRPLIDEPMRPWREANDEMGRLAGHVGHIGNQAGASARPEAGNTDTPARPAQSNTETGAAGAHSGHHR